MKRVNEMLGMATLMLLLLAGCGPGIPVSGGDGSESGGGGPETPAGPPPAPHACPTATDNLLLHAQVTLQGGPFFTGGWGGGLTVDPSMITNGLFLSGSNQWDSGAVWWDSRDNVDRSVLIELGGTYRIKSLVVQADDNDAYLLYYREAADGTWHLAWYVPNYDVFPDPSDWGMQTRPDPSDDCIRYTLPQPIITDALMVKGDVTNGDRLFALSEVQAFGSPVAGDPGENGGPVEGGTGDDPAGAGDAGSRLSAYGTAVIDGVLGPGEWDKAAKLELAAHLPNDDGGGTTPTTLFVMNDATNLYVALRIGRASFGGTTNPVLEFDNDNDGVSEDGDDGFGMSVGIYQPVEFHDIYRYTCPDAPAGSAGCSASDPETTRGILPAGTSDGAAEAKNDGSYTIIEMSHPLTSGDVRHDFALQAGDTVGFHLLLRLFSLEPACNFGPDCYADTVFPEAYAGQVVVASGEIH
jgi:hypothetical protein